MNKVKTKATVSYNLDKIDREIIYMLMDNVKSPLTVISDKIGISTTAIHQRIKKMERAGIIETSVSLLNPEKIGYKVVSFIGVFLEQPDHYQETIKAMKGISEIVEAHCTTGIYTIFLKAICRDNDHLMEVLNKIQKLKGIAKTETFISLEQSISRQLTI
ncbi:MAG: Lrp/AsnC ligand binding domain-containing protein [Flavobacteriaceae bacterium]|jgi:Lrp/AsnC family transcriptional regulator for asnA, asnC and gidA|nr:Lrp/AsnC ligand binding domain-containing protein [Flavobacteriaceae bacterium]